MGGTLAGVAVEVEWLEMLRMTAKVTPGRCPDLRPHQTKVEEAATEAVGRRHPRRILWDPQEGCRG